MVWEDKSDIVRVNIKIGRTLRGGRIWADVVRASIRGASVVLKRAECPNLCFRSPAAFD